QEGDDDRPGTVRAGGPAGAETPAHEKRAHGRRLRAMPAARAAAGCIAIEGNKAHLPGEPARLRDRSCTLLAMALTSEEVLHIARLARIALSDADVKRFTAHPPGILDPFAALAAVDTGGVEPTAHPLPLSNVMRDDLVAPSLPQAE